ncbi:hypothetical protein AF332_06695 [Sporosarcina globispora]|uniref:Sugar translocase n=1 Tax=Sporosarcina globispora TaxID=1459 RepID=A0A0M0G9H1_SPOGL|nr:oligosaccharide flippase family protein [Sporosarcina globispora]KON86545.1 hypothetical protein AF332_06695 [Sporosarcina globispora]
MKKLKKHTIGKNIFHLFYSTALSSALNAAALILLANYLQSYYYGMFSVALAFAMIMGYLTDAGLNSIVLREGSKKGADLSILMSSYLKVRIILLIAVFICGFGVIHLSHTGNRELILTSYFLIIPMVLGLTLQSIGTTFFQMAERMNYCGLIRIISSACLVIALSAGIIFSLNHWIICTLYGMSYLASGVFGVYKVSRNVQIRIKSKFHKGLLKNIGSFTLGGLLFVLLPHLGPLIIEKTLPLGEVGNFAVAYRIPQALQQIPFIVAGAFYPVLFRAFNNNLLEEHLQKNITLIKLMALSGISITLPLYAKSGEIIHFLFGNMWLDASLPLKILSIMVTLQAINIALADGLTTKGLQARRTAIQALAIIAGIFLYMLLSKSYGIAGAAFAGATIEGIALIGFWICNPSRWIVAKKAIVPYLSLSIISICSIELFFDSRTWIVFWFNFLLLCLVILIDKEIKSMIFNTISRLAFKWKTKETQGG